MDNILEGLVVSVSRRVITLQAPDGTLLAGTVSSNALDVAVGDRALYTLRGGAPFVSGFVPSSRCLYRSYRRDRKKMGANIDRLFVITAADSTLNLRVIDRMLVAAYDQQIPVCLVVNKIDLGLEPLEEVLDVYRDLEVDLITCAAKPGIGLDAFRQYLESPDLRVAALTGVSGVGKSSILKALVPEATCKVADLSARTGQGRQTTTQAQGYLYPNIKQGRVLIIDYPGIQFFGVSHIEKTRVRDAFPEFHRFSHSCHFANCMHLHEQVCGIKEALEDEQIAPWRYASYLHMVREVEEAKPY